MPAPRKPDRDEPVKIPLDPETALRALLAVQPDDSEETESEEMVAEGDPNGEDS